MNDKQKEVCREIISSTKERKWCNRNQTKPNKQNREASGNKRKACAFRQLFQLGYGSITIQSLFHGLHVRMWHLHLSLEISSDLESYTRLRALNWTMNNSGITPDVQQPLDHANWLPVITPQVTDTASASQPSCGHFTQRWVFIPVFRHQTVQFSWFNKVLFYVTPGKIAGPSMPKVIISTVSQLTW